MAKARPDSFTPRRLMSMMMITMPTAIGTRQGSNAGKAEAICATPDETDTETVRM